MNSIEKASIALMDFSEGLKGVIDEIRIISEEAKKASMHGDEYLTVEEVAAEVKSSTAWVYKKTKQKKNPLPCTKGGIVRVKRSHLVAWLESERLEEDGCTYEVIEGGDGRREH